MFLILLHHASLGIDSQFSFSKFLFPSGVDFSLWRDTFLLRRTSWIIFHCFFVRFFFWRPRERRQKPKISFCWVRKGNPERRERERERESVFDIFLSCGAKKETVSERVRERVKKKQLRTNAWHNLENWFTKLSWRQVSTETTFALFPLQF